MPIWALVLDFAILLVIIFKPLRDIIIRNPVTKRSRKIIRPTIQKSMSPIIANEMKAVSNFIPSSSWNKNKIQIKSDMNFNPNTDFVIIPEIWAHFAYDLLIRQKIKYAIFALGAYSMNSFYDHEKL